jgi:SAM-dependent methyltransferase
MKRSGWLRAGDYVTLWHLSRRRYRSSEEYRTFQLFQASLLITYLQSNGLVFQGKQVLDVGCSTGAYSQLFTQEGASVHSLDIEVHPMLATGVRGSMVVGDALELPIANDQFDFVFCASLIEHVPDPGHLLGELYRVLRTGGRCYVGFPPFYSPAGGHQFKPFHLLGERAAVALAGRGRWTYANVGGRWGLHRVTIGRARQQLIESGFVIDDISTKFLPVNFARIPVLGECLTWYAQFLVTKVGP